MTLPSFRDSLLFVARHMNPPAQKLAFSLAGYLGHHFVKPSI